MIARNGSTLEILLPVLGSVIGISTILGVYILTWKAGHLPIRTTTPPISFLGCNHPEHSVYQIGFTLTGVALFGAIEQWRHSIFYSRIVTCSGVWIARVMVGGGYLAAIGVVGQGLVTLEEDILDRLHMGHGISRQSIIHQQLAGIFFLGAAMHCYATAYCIVSTWKGTSSIKGTVSKSGQSHLTNVKEKTNGKIISQNKDPLEHTASTTVGCCYGVWSVRLKLLCVATSLLAWPIAETLHPARTASLDRRQFNIAGLAQYIAVASYILFFGSYTLDFASLRMRKQRGEERTAVPTFKEN